MLCPCTTWKASAGLVSEPTELCRIRRKEHERLMGGLEEEQGETDSEAAVQTEAPSTPTSGQSNSTAGAADVQMVMFQGSVVGIPFDGAEQLRAYEGKVRDLEAQAALAKQEALEEKCKTAEAQARLDLVERQLALLSTDLPPEALDMAKIQAELDVTREALACASAPRPCDRCCTIYLPLSTVPRSDDECAWHPVKQLRYGGCRAEGCFNDAYHPCCGRCPSCSAGCKQGRHVS